MILRRWFILAGICLSAVTLRAQIKQFDYDARWKLVDSLYQKKGLPETALAEVYKIAAIANQEHDQPQAVKALLYQFVLNGHREGMEPVTIKMLDSAILAASQPMKSILQSLLAKTYQDYFQAHRYNLYNRNKTVNFVKKDIATWGVDDFRDTISALYLSSLREEKLLIDTRLESYDPIIIKGNSRNLRPTLFDLLAHQALTFFKQSDLDIHKAADIFELDNPAALGDAGTFARYHFASADTASLHYTALLLLQRLIGLHLNDVRPDALIDVDIERISFANSYGVMDNKDSLYLKALSRITEKYGDEPAAAQAWFLQADRYATPMYMFDNTDSSDYNNVRAKAICDRVLAQKTNSEGQYNCRMLNDRITAKFLSVQAEKVTVPGEQIQGLVTWSNFDHLYVRLVSLDSFRNALPSIVTGNDKFWNGMTSRKPYRSYDLALPVTNDYRRHAADIAIGTLPAGVYALLGSSDSSWTWGKATMAVEYIYVSNLAYINKGRNYVVVNRKTGQPLSNAKVQVWKMNYAFPKKEAPLEMDGAGYTTDEQGHFLRKHSPNEGYGPRFLDISHSGERLFLRDVAIDYYYVNTETPVSKEDYEAVQTKVFFFLDRQIYRPGQTVWFKGLAVTKDKDTHQSKLLAGWPSRVFLYNANEEMIDSMDVKTNEYGSYHGSFRLPTGLLNGKFRISDDRIRGTSFSVEEYKRPAFFVEYGKQTGSYKVGDSIHVNGTAKAYAGNLLDGAMVRYRIVRRTRMPHPWIYWRRGRSIATEQEIKHGEIKTDAKGNFPLVFLAAPDRSIDRSGDPRFEYVVTADVTDINGETRSGSVTIVAGYTSVNLSIDVPGGDQQSADRLGPVLVKTTNLSGEPVASVVGVDIYALQSPKRLIRSRLLPKADRWVLSEKEFLDHFPLDEYRNELQKESWARGEKVWGETVGSSAVAGSAGTGSADLTIPAGRLKPGWYLIEARTKDKYGQEVKDMHYLELVDGKTGRPADPQYDWVSDQAETVEPGGKVLVEAGSSAADVYVLRSIDRPETSDSTMNISTLRLNRDGKTTELTVSEADRGGIKISDAFVRDNRIFTHQHTVSVPWTNKQLTIRYASYRDKTQPGSAEKWSVTVAGQHGDKLSGEVLSTMYDASLDQFVPNHWGLPSLYPVLGFVSSWSGNNFGVGYSQMQPENRKQSGYFAIVYDQLFSSNEMRVMRMGLAARNLAADRAPLAFASGEVAYKDGFQHDMNPDTRLTIRGSGPVGANQPIYIVDGIVVTEAEKAKLSPDDLQSVTVLANAEAVALYGAKAANGAIVILTKKGAAGGQQPVQVRKNFNETAFFFPDLRTDSAGNVSFSFTMPDALTSWKWMTLAHTRNLAFGYSEKTIITQKQLMVQPNLPRFLREGDHMDLAVKVVNLTDSEMTGQVMLQLTDPTTGETADGWFTNRQPNQYFTVGAGQSAVISFPLVVPYQYNRPLTYRVVAESRGYSDGEEASLPVVSNRMLVTETLPLNLKGNGTRHFTFDKLLQSGGSETLNHHSLTVEFTSNPAWYAVQALPYLMEYPYECAEQSWNRYYANALASKIVGASPRLQEVFARWRTQDTAALLSNLQKNPELKTVLLEETPWVLEGKTESQQKKNIALLLDMGRMDRELGATLDRVAAMQGPDGGFAWFKGGYPDLFITQYILTGIGHLQKLGAIPASMKARVAAIVKAALPFVDGEMVKIYKKDRTVGIGQLAVQYLYMRSFYADYGVPGDVFPVMNFYRKKVQAGWVQQPKYLQGMIALALFRTGDIQTAKDIIRSLRQTAIIDEEKGMYWKGMEGGYYWYEAPIETEALLIEAFREVTGDMAVDRDLKTWLLKQKQTQNWRTTKATADACYALLLGGQDWLSGERVVEMKLGDKVVTAGAGDVPGGAGGATGGAGGAPGGANGAEAGTGYFKKVFDGPFVNAGMGDITVKMGDMAAGAGSGSKGGAVAGGGPAWGAVYWQYFDMLDRIVPPGSSKVALKLEKKLFIERNTDAGKVLDPVGDNGVLKPGDRVIVRIELRVDRDMEYVHMKDMRAACMEPVNVISQYKWQGGLGYYESTKDASTDFFFSSLRKGVYVFEYPLLVGQSGNFSNGITSIECMYAPEFAYHTEGIRVSVEGAQ